MAQKDGRAAPDRNHPPDRAPRPRELSDKLDAWIERQPDAKLPRPEAIRRLLERALKRRNPIICELSAR